jgi:hypothetical protein
VSATHLLIRTKEISRAVMELADELQTISGHPATLIVDASGGDVRVKSRAAIGLSVATCSALGLHCPSDFAWRCGDYGYYLARRQLPDARLFWMIEADVRFYGRDPAHFFRFFASRPEVDFLAGRLRPADPSWYWRNTARARDVSPYRCLFPVTRLSARATDASFARRIAHGKRASRRILWPNDEALVATTLVNSGFVSRDFNDFGSVFYCDETFNYGAPLNGDCLELSPPTVQMAHPVLFGGEYQAKMQALQSGPASAAAWRRPTLSWAAVKLNVLSRW